MLAYELGVKQKCGGGAVYGVQVGAKGHIQSTSINSISSAAMSAVNPAKLERMQTPIISSLKQRLFRYPFYIAHHRQCGAILTPKSDQSITISKKMLTKDQHA
jgi:hypothetical protein